MRRLGELDFPDRVSPHLSTGAAQLLFAMICTIAPILARQIVDISSPRAGPFALAYPAVMIATLFGRWQAGLITLIATLTYAWYAVLPPAYSFVFAEPTDRPRLIVNAITMLVVLILSEAFRRAVRHAVEERNRQIENRDLLLAELDHRVRNNFASVMSLLHFQLQRADDDATRDALTITMNRVEGIAQANRYLYRQGGLADRVEMNQYLPELCEALSESLFAHGNARLSWLCDRAEVSRDQAVSLGLLINELVTNAAKHAFPDGREGRVTVSFQQDGQHVRLCVEDDGCGIAGKARNGSLGRRLIDAFARQAGGTLSTETSSAGTRVTLTLQQA